MRALAILAAAAVLAAGLVAAAGGGDPASAARKPRGAYLNTYLMTRALDGGLPNGPSRNAAISHDLRVARLFAFQSDASDLVTGDTNGRTDVFMVIRRRPYGKNGTRWALGPNRLVSRGRGGLPANGRSYAPAVDGRPHRSPRCVAFVSAASNLVRGDTNGKPDAFVYDIRKRSLRRVSVSTRGSQSNGSTYDVAIDGECERIAFTSDATNLALGKTKNRSWKRARTTRPPAGVPQVYVRVIRGDGRDSKLKGLTFLASASNSRRAGNGPSYDPSFSFYRRAVAFTSRATNLNRRDRQPRSDVYIRDFETRLAGKRGRRYVAVFPRTTLVSATSRGRPGNGPSSAPAFSEQGFFVAFQTDASDLLPGDRNGVTDIARKRVSNRRSARRLCRRNGWVSKVTGGGAGNGPSRRPEVAAGGCYVVFDSDASNFRQTQVGPDRNGVSDCFLYTAVRNRTNLESQDSTGGRLRLPCTNPALSSRANYILFETADPFADRRFARARYPGLFADPARAFALARANPDFHQIYQRYLGPK